MKIMNDYDFETLLSESWGMAEETLRSIKETFPDKDEDAIMEVLEGLFDETPTLLEVMAYLAKHRDELLNAIEGASKVVDNPPYGELTLDKRESLGETMALKDALNLWWNSVMVRTDKGVQCCYKRYDSSYELDDLKGSDILKNVKLDEEWEEDADGYPIVFATLLED